MPEKRLECTEHNGKILFVSFICLLMAAGLGVLLWRQPKNTDIGTDHWVFAVLLLMTGIYVGLFIYFISRYKNKRVIWESGTLTCVNSWGRTKTYPEQEIKKVVIRQDAKYASVLFIFNESYHYRLNASANHYDELVKRIETIYEKQKVYR